MSKASEKALGELHAQLAKVLRDALAPTADADGVLLPASPAILNVARQFLKDNHIEVGDAASNEGMQGLAGLPVFEEDGNVVSLRK